MITCISKHIITFTNITEKDFLYLLFTDSTKFLADIFCFTSYILFMF